MPRLKNVNGPRQRCSRACHNCKKRKEKCEGRHPCARCVKRGVECRFAQISDKSNGTSPGPHPGTSSRGAGTRTAESDEEEEVDRSEVYDRSSREPREHSSNADVAVQQGAESAEGLPITEAPVPNVARLLRDGQGIFIYIGDSASLSFVQNVRRVVLSKLGECEFTTDSLRHSFFEQTPSHSNVAIGQYCSHHEGNGILPSLGEAELLLNQYLIATSGFLDLFDNAELSQNLRAWTAGHSSDDHLSDFIYHLILAIGAQVTAENGHDVRAERLFRKAQPSLSSSLTESPTIQTVQCYTLNAMFMLGACRRNSSFMSFGVAIRAAYALGLHRTDLHPIFSDAERHSRRRVWQSLRVLDLFLSASLGRPPSTSDYIDVLSPGQSPPKSNRPYDERLASAMVRLCEIFERTLLEVYRRRGVSTHVADSISRQYRDWTSQLPPPPSPLEDGTESMPHPINLSHILGWAHLTTAYHWSIILLTRPFLMFCISSANRSPSSFQNLHKTGRARATSISTFADACVDSAISGVDIADDLIRYPSLPKRLPFILNAVFNCALAIGAAFFGDYDHSFPLHDGMDKAKRVLEHLRAYDPQARRYAEIVTLLAQAIEDYLRARDRLFMLESSKRKTDLFGTIGSLNPKTAVSPIEDLGRKDAEPVTTLQQIQREKNKDLMARSGIDPQETQYRANWLEQQPATYPSNYQSTFTASGIQTTPTAVNERDPIDTNQSLDSLERADSAMAAPDPYYLAFYEETIPIFSPFGIVDDTGLQFPDHRNFVVPMNP